MCIKLWNYLYTFSLNYYFSFFNNVRIKCIWTKRLLDPVLQWWWFYFFLLATVIFSESIFNVHLIELHHFPIFSYLQSLPATHPPTSPMDLILKLTASFSLFLLHTRLVFTYLFFSTNIHAANNTDAPSMLICLCDSLQRSASALTSQSKIKSSHLT